PTPVANNPIPLQSASLAGGTSSSFRVVAGADLGSTNPLALQPLTMEGATRGKSVIFDGHTAYVDSSGFAVLAPTMLRTGTGAIDVAAGNGIALFNVAAAQANDADVTVPGVIYTAGAPVASAPSGGPTLAIVHAGTGYQDILVTPAVNPDSAGDITIRAQGDITGAEYL
ncbi:hypothetical protein, partial [Burkholderia contaminans]